VDVIIIPGVRPHLTPDDLSLAGRIVANQGKVRVNRRFAQLHYETQIINGSRKTLAFRPLDYLGGGLILLGLCSYEEMCADAAAATHEMVSRHAPPVLYPIFRRRGGRRAF
jgi:hypothetical protein